MPPTRSEQMQWYVVEFRSGSYFTGPDASNGGDLEMAMRFDSVDGATKYIDHYAVWIWVNGGMVCSYEQRRKLHDEAIKLSGDLA